ncbi:hypothetical protein ACFE04_004936 [Oxalis oulophora]
MDHGCYAIKDHRALLKPMELVEGLGKKVELITKAMNMCEKRKHTSKRSSIVHGSSTYCDPMMPPPSTTGHSSTSRVPYIGSSAFVPTCGLNYNVALEISRATPSQKEIDLLLMTPFGNSDHELRSYCIEQVLCAWNRSRVLHLCKS